VSDWPDTEGAVRTWLRASTVAHAVVADRIYFGVPKESPTWPLVTIQRVGGGNDASDAPVDNALIQLDCWGTLHPNGNGDKAGCLTVANAVRSALEVVNDTLIATSVRASIEVESIIWLPDANNDRPRYVVTANVWAWRVA